MLCGRSRHGAGADHALGGDRPRSASASSCPRSTSARCAACPTSSSRKASSTINFLRQLGGAVGIGLVGNVLEWRLRTHPLAPLDRLSRDLRACRCDHRLRRRRRRPDGPGPAAGQPRSPTTNEPRHRRAPGALRRARGRRRSGRQCRARIAGAGRPSTCVLVDQHAFPRDKVCGDGLIPDALRRARRLGVLDEVMAEAQPVGDARLHRPARRPDRRARLAGGAAAEARSTRSSAAPRSRPARGMFAPLRFVAPLREDGRVVGAELEHGGAVARDPRPRGSCSPPARCRRRRWPPACASGARRAASPCAATSATRR